jgi:hypothetical protein
MWVVSLLNWGTNQHVASYRELAASTVACVSADVDNLSVGGVNLFASTSGATSSSISVVSVPFDVTGDGPTISNGLFIFVVLSLVEPSLELGLRLDEPAELCADLQEKVLERWADLKNQCCTYNDENRGELV